MYHAYRMCISEDEGNLSEVSGRMRGHDPLSGMLAILTTVPSGVVTTVLQYLVIRTATRNALRECN